MEKEDTTKEPEKSKKKKNKTNKQNKNKSKTTRESERNSNQPNCLKKKKIKDQPSFLSLRPTETPGEDTL
jgi:hypothetical protein